MKLKNKKNIVILFISFLLTTTLIPTKSASADPIMQEAKILSERLENLRKENKNLEHEFFQLRNEKDRLTKDVAQSQHEIDQRKKEYDRQLQKKEALKKLENEVKKEEAKNTDLRLAIKSTKSDISKLNKTLQDMVSFLADLMGKMKSLFN